MKGQLFRATGVISCIGDIPSNRDIMVVCDDELGNYYRCLVQRSIGMAYKVGKPMWKYHITVAIGKYNPISDDLLEKWLQYDGSTVQYWYSNDIQSDGLYFWLPVKCDYISDIRESLGFPRPLKYPLHLTIGNLK